MKEALVLDMAALGETALIVLWSMVMLVVAYALVAVKKSGVEAKTAYLYSLLLLALPFFIWAIVNTAGGSFDLGMISMGLVLLTVGIALVIAPALSWLSVGGSLAVTANYA